MVEKRKSNFEWLRVIAMAMIVTLHYMFKGEIVSATDITAANFIPWLLTSMSICAVNVYVLISGYFLVETEFKLSRLIGLVAQVLEYGIIVTVAMILVGVVNIHELSVYDWASYVFPIGTENYWFITAYIVMYMLAPILSAGVKAVNEKTLRTVIIVMLILFCLEKTIIPMRLPIDRSGYDFGWFIVLFMIAAYIRLYGIKYLEGSIGRPFVMYALSSVLIFATGLCGNVISNKTGIETARLYADNVYDYNHVFVLAAAVGLFYLFKNLSFNEDSKMADISRLIGPLTLGVYLLHEHILVRYRWFEWLGLGKVKVMGNPVAVIGHWLVCVVIVMIVGMFTEWCRRKLVNIITAKH